jgi:hypothetical protein
MRTTPTVPWLLAGVGMAALFLFDSRWAPDWSVDRPVLERAMAQELATVPAAPSADRYAREDFDASDGLR